MCFPWIKLITSHHALFVVISISTSHDYYCYCVHFTTRPNKITQDSKESNQTPCMITTHIYHISQAIARCAPRSYNAKTITLNLVAIHLLHPFALISLSFHSIHLRATTKSPFSLSPSLFFRSSPTIPYLWRWWRCWINYYLLFYPL